MIIDPDAYTEGFEEVQVLHKACLDQVHPLVRALADHLLDHAGHQGVRDVHKVLQVVVAAVLETQTPQVHPIALEQHLNQSGRNRADRRDICGGEQRERNNN